MLHFTYEKLFIIAASRYKWSVLYRQTKNLITHIFHSSRGIWNCLSRLDWICIRFHESSWRDLLHVIPLLFWFFCFQFDPITQIINHHRKTRRALAWYVISLSISTWCIETSIVMIRTRSCAQTNESIVWYILFKLVLWTLFSGGYHFYLWLLMDFVCKTVDAIVCHCLFICTWWGHFQLPIAAQSLYKQCQCSRKKQCLLEKVKLYNLFVHWLTN